jgi:hypothetical protein
VATSFLKLIHARMALPTASEDAAGKLKRLLKKACAYRSLAAAAL